MKLAACVAVFSLLLPLQATAQLGLEDSLLDRLVGNWVLKGTIGGVAVTHDITADWVLGHHYLRLYELAREKDTSGAPAYEAIVFIGWDEPTSRYACLWLDITGGGGLTADGIGHAEPHPDELAFLFDTEEYGLIHTTFAYRTDTDTWQWFIDVERDGKRSVFARVTLTRP